MAINIIGIGPGDLHYLTHEATTAIQEASVLIGSKRQIDSMKAFISETCQCIAYEKSISAIQTALESFDTDRECIGILASGDPMFYGITGWLKRTFKATEFHVISGISSLQVLFQKTEVPMHDVYLTSAHGRPLDMDKLIHLPLVGLLTDKTMTPYRVAQAYLEKGLNPTIIIGENLGYPDECITESDAKSVDNKDYKMNVVIIKNER